jgi:hypothetical protein
MPNPDPCLLVKGQRHKGCIKGMPNPGSLFTCRGPKTKAVSWRTENQIINSSYHKNMTRSDGGLLDYPQHWMLLTLSQGGEV